MSNVQIIKPVTRDSSLLSSTQKLLSRKKTYEDKALTTNSKIRPSPQSPKSNLNTLSSLRKGSEPLKFELPVSPSKSLMKLQSLKLESTSNYKSPDKTNAEPFHPSNFAIAKLLEMSQRQASLPNLHKFDLKNALTKSPSRNEKANDRANTIIKSKFQENFHKRGISLVSLTPRHSNTTRADISIDRCPISKSRNITPTKAFSGSAEKQHRWPNGNIEAFLNEDLPDKSFTSHVIPSYNKLSEVPKLKLSTFGSPKASQFIDKSNILTGTRSLKEISMFNATPRLTRDIIYKTSSVANSRVNLTQRNSGQKAHFELSEENRERLDDMLHKDVLKYFEGRATNLGKGEFEEEDDEEEAEVVNLKKFDLSQALKEYGRVPIKPLEKMKTIKFRPGEMIGLVEKEKMKPTFEEKKWKAKLPIRAHFAIGEPEQNTSFENKEQQVDFEGPETDYLKKSKSGMIETAESIGEFGTVIFKTKMEFKRKPADVRPKQISYINRERYKRVRKALRERLMKYVDLKLTLKDVIENRDVFPLQPYQKPRSEEFIKAAKSGDYKLVKSMLAEDRCFVYQFDTTKQTALHWASKRGHHETVRILLEYRADPDALTLVGRTSLYYAMMGGYSEVVRLLLYWKASPWNMGASNLSYKSIVQNTKCLIYLKKARRERIHKWEKEREMLWSIYEKVDILEKASP